MREALLFVRGEGHGTPPGSADETERLARLRDQGILPAEVNATKRVQLGL